MKEIEEIINDLTIMRKLYETISKGENKFSFQFLNIVFIVAFVLTMINAFFFKGDLFLEGIILGIILTGMLFAILRIVFALKVMKLIKFVERSLFGVKIEIRKNGEVREIK